MKHEGNSSRDDDNNGILMQPTKSVVPSQIQIVPIQPKTITHLPKRPPVDLAFTDLVFKVREGRKASEYIYLKNFKLVIIITHQLNKQKQFLLD